MECNQFIINVEDENPKFQKPLKKWLLFDSIKKTAP